MSKVIAVALSLLVAAATMATAGADPAAAQSGALTLSASTELQDGQRILVTADGVVDTGGVDNFLGSRSLRPAVFQCSDSLFAANLDAATSAFALLLAFRPHCDRLSPIGKQISGPGLLETVAVRRTLRGDFGWLPSGPRDCTTGCSIVVFAASDAGGVARVDYFEAQSIAFGPQAAVVEVETLEGDSGPSPIEIAVRFDPPPGQAVTISYATADGTAVAGEDYVATSGSFVAQAGETSGSFPVEIIGDTEIERDEAFQVTLTSSLPDVGVAEAAEITILDDDEPVPPSVTPSSGLVDGEFVDVTAIGVFDDGGVVTAYGRVLRPAVHQCAAGVSDLDFGAPNSADALFFEFGSFCSRITPPGVRIGDDGVLDQRVAVRRVLEPPFSTSPVDCATADCVLAVFAASSPDGQLRVDYFEWTPIDFGPTALLEDVVVQEGDGESTIQVTLTMNRAAAQPATFDYATADGTNPPNTALGNATAGIDYRAADGSIVIPAGQTVGTIEIALLGDTDIERDETLSLTVESSTPGFNTGPPSTITIANDDDPGPPSVTPTTDLVDGQTVRVIADGVFDKGGVGSGFGQALRPGIWQCAFPESGFDPSSFATGDALFLGLNNVCVRLSPVGASTPPSGRLDRSVRVSAVVDVPPPFGGTSVDCRLADCVLAIVAASDGLGTVSIDTFATVPIEFNPAVFVADTTVPERDSGETTVQITVTLSRAAPEPVTIDYATADGTNPPNTPLGNATAGEDYVATAGSIIIPAGETTASIEIAIRGDTELERDESLTLSIQSGTPGVTAGPPATITIANDDLPAPPPTVTPSADLVDEQLVRVTADGVFDNGGVTTTFGQVLRPAVWQCGLEPGFDPSSSTGNDALFFEIIGRCVRITPVGVRVDDDGTLDQRVRVRSLLSPAGPLIDCRVSDCVVAVIAASNGPGGPVIDFFETTSIEFAPAAGSTPPAVDRQVLHD